MIRIDEDRYWLFAVVDPDTDELPQTRLETTRIDVIAIRFFADLRGEYDVDDAVFPVSGATPLGEAYRRHCLRFRYERHGRRNSAERDSCAVKSQRYYFSNFSSYAEPETADEWLPRFAFAWN